MTPTSKPAVTPEMVEKARQWLHDRPVPMEEYFSTVELDRTLKVMAEFAASAVQDAVRECAIMLESWQIPETFHKASFYTDGERGADEMLRHVAAALREKYGVKP